MTKPQLMRRAMLKLKLCRSDLARKLGTKRTLVTKTIDHPSLVKEKDTSLALVRLCLENGMVDEMMSFIETYSGGKKITSVRVHVQKLD